MADIITTEYDDGSVDDFIQCGVSAIKTLKWPADVIANVRGL